MRYSYNLLKEYVEGEFGKDNLIEWLEILGFNPSIVSMENSDVIFELELPANRGDLFSSIGIAREILPFQDLTLKLPDTSFEERSNDKIEVEIENISDCSYYSCRIIKNVKVEQSPEFIRKKIEKLGFRSTNNVVDISNFVMAETGQPLHIFDLDKIKKKIVVRRARQGEKLGTLDGKERNLNSEALIIADREKPVAIAGIMGGSNSEVSPETKNILIESAEFNPVRVRCSSKTLGIITEASLRFEKGVEIESVRRGIDRTTNLIYEICKGDVCPLNFSGILKEENPKIRFSGEEKVNSYLGTNIPVEFMETLFSKLSFRIEKKNRNVYIIPPVYRKDLKEEVDIIEEIARYWKYSEIPESFPVSKLIPTSSEIKFEQIEQVKNNMVNLGFVEVVNSSLISEDIVKTIGLESVSLVNPLSNNLGFLRPTIIPCILENMRFNLSHQLNNFKIFEVGNIYYIKENRYMEKMHLSIGILNSGDFFTIKGAVSAILERCGISNVVFKAENHPLAIKNGGMAVYCGDLKIGFILIPSEKIKSFFEVSQEDIYIGEIYMNSIYDVIFPEKLFRELPRYPSSRRDLSFLFPEEILWQDVENLIWAQKMPVERIEVFDIYKGRNIPEGKISISFSLIFRDTGKTLKSEDVEMYLKTLVNIIKKKFNVSIRGC